MREPYVGLCGDRAWVCHAELRPPCAEAYAGTGSSAQESNDMAKANDRHHVVPRARCRELGIPPNFHGNIRRISVSKHRAWHTLFGTALPEEAVDVIRREWGLPEEGERTLRGLLGNVSLLRRKR